MLRKCKCNLLRVSSVGKNTCMNKSDCGSNSSSLTNIPFQILSLVLNIYVSIYKHREVSIGKEADRWADRHWSINRLVANSST